MTKLGLLKARYRNDFVMKGEVLQRELHGWGRSVQPPSFSPSDRSNLRRIEKGENNGLRGTDQINQRRRRRVPALDLFRLDAEPLVGSLEKFKVAVHGDTDVTVHGGSAACGSTFSWGGLALFTGVYRNLNTVT